eukprot:g6232.t1
MTSKIEYAEFSAARPRFPQLFFPAFYYQSMVMRGIIGTKFWAGRRDDFFRTRGHLKKVRERNDKEIRQREAIEEATKKMGAGKGGGGLGGLLGDGSLQGALKGLATKDGATKAVGAGLSLLGKAAKKIQNKLGKVDDEALAVVYNVGDEVTLKMKGWSASHPGTVASVHRELPTVDIKMSDGETQIGVGKQYVTLVRRLVPLKPPSKKKKGGSGGGGGGGGGGSGGSAGHGGGDEGGAQEEEDEEEEEEEDAPTGRALTTLKHRGKWNVDSSCKFTQGESCDKKFCKHRWSCCGSTDFSSEICPTEQKKASMDQRLAEQTKKPGHVESNEGEGVFLAKLRKQTANAKASKR